MNQLKVMRTVNVLLSLWVLTPSELWAQSESEPTQYTFSGQLLFWTVGVLIMGIMARFVFQEQIHERRTLRRLINEIGPFYQEFDIDAVKHWVSRCAAHVWRGWQTGNMESLRDFSTPEFLEEEERFVQEALANGQARHAELDTILKVHPLGIYMVGPGPAPRDVELMLRLEIKGVDYTLDQADRIVHGTQKVRQVQHFWLLRNDGVQWRIHRVWEALEDATDLVDRPEVPPVNEWSRPKLDSDDLLQG